MPTTPARVLALRAAGTSFAVELTEPVPRVLHWGADLGDLDDAAAAALALTAEGAVLNNALDVTRRFTVWPTEADGWHGTPAHQGHLAGGAAAPRPVLSGASVRHDPQGGGEIALDLTDASGGLDLSVRYTLHPSGVLTAAASLTRRAARPATGAVTGATAGPGAGPAATGPGTDPAAGGRTGPVTGRQSSGPGTGAGTAAGARTGDARGQEAYPPVDQPAAPPVAPPADPPYDLAQATTLLPVPRRATEILDFTGKWSRERSPQRLPLVHGAHTREVRRGKPGADSPYLLVLGEPGFGFGHGEVWAVHVAWSGDQRYLAEHLPEGAGVHAAALGGGELLRPGEIRLAPGETYHLPPCHFAWSGQGLDGLAARFHTLLRARPTHPATPRPLMLNSWEAVYFDHDLDHLLRLADRAAEVGVERFVLDDGWFTGRRDDRAGLGDWTVDPRVWPRGLGPLADHVRSLGMEFGLWVEPEMINLDSGSARAHPDWVLAPAAGPGPSARHQYVLDLAHPDAWAYLLTALDALVTEYGIGYLKWDHNRELHEAVRGPGDRPASHGQVTALYRLLDTLKERHPGLEIESCASGGGRIDLGILARTDRVWASDCNDPVERQHIQRWTGQLLPPELVGAHIGPSPSHTTGRATADSFRLATALFGHAGIEQDLTACAPDELARLTAWAAMYRELRPLLHGGTSVRADLDSDAVLLHGVVAHDGSAALYCWARTATSAEGQAGRVRLPGLAPDGSYRVRVRTDLGLPAFNERVAPRWFESAISNWVTLPGAVAAVAGLPLPALHPQQALLIEVRR